MLYEIYQAIFEKLTDPEEEAARRCILAKIEAKKDDMDIESWYQRMRARIMEGKNENIRICMQIRFMSP